MRGRDRAFVMLLTAVLAVSCSDDAGSDSADADAAADTTGDTLADLVPDGLDADDDAVDVADDGPVVADVAGDGQAIDVAADAPIADQGGDGAHDGGDETPSNQLPEARLAYEIVLNEWTNVAPGATVTRPVEIDINWNACAAVDPDGEIAEIFLHHAGDSGRGTRIQGPDLPCHELTQTDHSPRERSQSTLLVIDDQGGESRLRFWYETE